MAGESVWDKDPPTLSMRAALLRRMSPTDKVRRWADACRTTKILLLHGIRIRKPTLSSRESRLELLTLVYGTSDVQSVLQRNPDWSPEPLTEDIQAVMEFVGVLTDLGMAYHIGGSFASVISGEPRQTRDVDVIVRFPPWKAARFMQLASVRFDLPTTSDRIMAVAREGGSFTAIHRATGFEMDVLISDGSPFDEEEFAGCLTIALGDPPAELRVKSPTHIVLRKLLWYRAGGEVSERQWRDAAGVMRVNRGALDRSYMQKWALKLGIADLLERLEQEVEGGQVEQMPP